MMRRVRWFSGWKIAWVLAWTSVLGLIGLTIAELTNYSSIIQFYGDSLIFSWEGGPSQHHYRIYLTTENMMLPVPAESCSTLYSDESSIEIETLPGLAYSMRVQALTAAGDASELSDQSPAYLCLGSTDPATGRSQVFLPNETALGPSFPNPFNSAATIPFKIASEDGSPVGVSMRIYNTMGQVVRQLLDEDRYPGQYRAIWDGRNDQGMLVGAGTYICLLQAGDYTGTRLLVFMK